MLAFAHSVRSIEVARVAQVAVGITADEALRRLVEYALVVALIAFGATAGMTALAGGINSAFNTISSKLSTSM